MDLTSKIFSDLKSYRFMYLILCISMMPLIMYGYSSYLLIILLPYIFFKRIDSGTCLVLLFSFFYSISFIIRNEELAVSKYVFYSIFPFIVYTCGSILGARFRYPQTILLVWVSLVSCLAVPGLFYSIRDVMDTGELVKFSRQLEYADGKVLSATGYGMMFSLAIAGIGVIAYPAKSSFDKSLKRFLVVLSFLAIFGTIHILNRTGLALGLIAIVTVILIPPYNTKRLVYILLMCCIISSIFVIFLSDTAIMSDAVQGYLDREEIEGYSAATGGGRFERWGDALLQISSNPFGTFGYYMNGGYNYAHNLWLDAGLRGGLVPFIILLVITYHILKCTFRVIHKRLFTPFEGSYLMALCAVMLSQAMTEPVIEGLFQYFLIMIFFYGCVSALSKRNVIPV